MVNPILAKTFSQLGVQKRMKQKTTAKPVDQKTVIPKKHLFDKTELFSFLFSSKRCFFYGERTIFGTYEMGM